MARPFWAWRRLCLSLLFVFIHSAPTANGDKINYNLWVPTQPHSGSESNIINSDLCMYINYSVHSWADKLGLELFSLGDFITRRKEVQEVSRPIDFSHWCSLPLFVVDVWRLRRQQWRRRQRRPRLRLRLQQRRHIWVKGCLNRQLYIQNVWSTRHVWQQQQ